MAIVIVTLDRIESLKSCVFSLLKTTYGNYEIIVVDNASTDGTADIVRSLFPYVRLIRSEENLGYTGGNNKGIAYALEHDCDYILVLNDDVVVDPDLLKNLVDVAKQDPKIGLACPKLLCFEIPNKLFKEYGKYNFYLGMNHQPLSRIDNPQEIGLAPGASFLVTKDLMRRIGLMDERFFLYFDEGDLCCRIKKAGFKMMFVPSAKAFHKVSQSFSGWANPVVLYYSTRNELLLARKHLNFLIFFPLWVPRFGFRIADYLVRFRKIALIKAMLRGLYDFTRNKYGQTDTSITW